MGSLALFFLLAGLLGFYLPWRLGFEFLDAAVLLPYACLSSLDHKCAGESRNRFLGRVGRGKVSGLGGAGYIGLFAW